MSYGLVALVVSIGLTIRYLTIRDASAGSKVARAVALGASLLIWWHYPQWLLAAILLQVAVSIYVLVYLKVNPYAS